MAQGGKSKLLGLGFIFGAKDDGAEKKAKGLKESFDSLKSSVQAMSQRTAGIQKFGNAINALNLMQLTRINNALDGIASQSGALGPRAGDTALESFGIQFNQSFKQATAGMGEFRKEVDKLKPQISGVAHSLQVDGGDILKAVTAVARTGKTLKDYGLTVRDLGGSIQANILGGEQLGTLLTGLSEGYDLGADGATKLLDKITAIGSFAGAGADAVRQMPAAVAAADEVIASLGTGSIDEALESITRLAVASQDRLGGDFNTAMSDAINVFKQLGGQKTQLRDLVTGLGSDFPKLAQEIGIASSDIDGALEMATSNPIKFAESLQKLMSQMDPTSAQSQRLLASLEGMPDGFKFLVTGGDKAAAALKKAQKPVGEFEGSFSKMAKGASGDTRTFGERMELEADRFKTALNTLGSAGKNDTIRSIRAGHNATINFLKSLAGGKYGPTLSKLTKAFFVFRRQGVVGLINYAKKEFPRFVSLMDSIKNTWKSFDAAWQKNGFVAAVKKTVGPALSKMFTSMFEGMGDWVDDQDWGAIGNKIGKAIDRLFSSKDVNTGAVHGFEKLLVSVGNAIPSMMSGIVSAAGWKAFIPLLFTGFGKQILSVGVQILGKSMMSMGGHIAGLLGSVVKTIGKKAGGVFASIGKSLFKNAGKMGSFALKKIPFIGPIISLLFDLPSIIEDFKAGNIQQAFMRLFTSVLNGLTFGIPDILASLFGMDLVEDIVMPGLNTFNDLFADGMDIIYENAVGMWDKLMGYGQWAFGVLGDVFDWFAGLWDAMKKGVVDGWGYIVSGVKGAFVSAFKYVENFFFGLFDKFEGFLLMVKRGFQEIPVFILSTMQSMMSNSVVSTMLEKFAGVTGVDIKGNLDRALKDAKQAVSDTAREQEELKVRVRDREREYAQSQAPTRSMGGDAATSAQESLKRQLDRETSKGRQQMGPQEVVITGHTPKAARELEIAHQKGATGARRVAGASRGSSAGSAGDVM